MAKTSRRLFGNGDPLKEFVVLISRKEEESDNFQRIIKIAVEGIT